MLLLHESRALRGQLWPHLGTPVRPAQPLAEDRYLVEGQAAGVGREREVVARRQPPSKATPRR